jgi:hypothetical protein
MNIFEEMKEIEILQKRIDFITSMKDSLVETDANMNEVKYWSSEWLVKRYLGMTEEDLRSNAHYKKIEDEEKLKKAKADAEATGM